MTGWLSRWLPFKRTDLPRETVRKLAALETAIGYRFRNKALLQDALRHRSSLQQTGHDRSRSNERLEFLGDAVLDFVIAEYFFNLFSTMAEGELTKLRSVIASGSVLVRAADKIELGQYIEMSANEERTGGRGRASILEDAFEALIGAIYLDRGHQAAIEFVENNLLANWRDVVQQKEFINYKSLLLEHAQAKQWSAPVYALREESGPDHSKRFVVDVVINGVVHGRGEGRSKKAAEQEAAQRTASQLGLVPQTQTPAKGR